MLLVGAKRASEARKVAEKLSDEARASAEGRSLFAQLELSESAGNLAELRAALAAEPQDLAKRIALGKALVASGATEEGLETLFEAAIQDVGFQDGAPRKALVEVFQALGTTHPLALEYQQRLSVLLCS